MFNIDFKKYKGVFNLFLFLLSIISILFIIAFSASGQEAEVNNETIFLVPNDLLCGLCARAFDRHVCRGKRPGRLLSVRRQCRRYKWQRPQRHSVTRFRVSNGWPSARSTGIAPLTHSGPSIGPAEVASVVTAISGGRSGSMSSCGAVSRA